MINNAFNSVGSGSPNIYNYGQQKPTPNMSVYTPPPITHPTVTTPVKKQVTTSQNGTVQETHFDNTPQQGVKGMLGGSSGPDIYNYGQKKTPNASMAPTASYDLGNSPTGTPGGFDKARVNPGTNPGVLPPATQVSGSTTQNQPTPTIPSFIGDGGLTQKSYASGVADTTGTPQTAYQSNVGVLQNYGNGQNNNPVVGAATTGLLGTAGQAKSIADNYRQQIDDLGTRGVGAETGYASSMGGGIGVGNAGLVTNNVTGRINALNSAENAALQGVGYQQSGFNQAGGLGTSQQGQNIGAATSATGYTAPTTQFGVLTDPTTGKAISPDGGMAAAVQGGKILGAQSAAQSNASTAGAAAVSANNAVYQQAFNDYANTQQSAQNVDNFGKILMDPSQNGGVNPFDVNYGNKTWADIKSNFSSATQAKFDSTLAALQSKVRDLLNAGGNSTPTSLVEDSRAILSGTASLKTIGAVLDRIGNEGNTLLKTLEDKKNTAYQGIQGGNTSSGSSGSGTTSFDF